MALVAAGMDRERDWLGRADTDSTRPPRPAPIAESGRGVGARDSKQSDRRSLVARARGTPRVVGAPSSRR